MRCSKCRRWIEGAEIEFAREGDLMGKPLCKKCKAEVEEQSREKYREGLVKKHTVGNHYRSKVYKLGSDDPYQS